MSGKPHIDERRITERLLGYWNQVSRGRPMPEECDIDPDALGKDWPHCFLLQTRDIEQIEQFNFTYLGEAILQTYKTSGIDPENLFLVGPNAFYLAPIFRKVVETTQPIIDHSHFITDDGHKVLYRQCMLPLGSNNRVEAIFGAMVFKVEH